MCANKYPHVPPVELLANINNDIHHFFMNRAERMSGARPGTVTRNGLYSLL